MIMSVVQFGLLHLVKNSLWYLGAEDGIWTYSTVFKRLQSTVDTLNDTGETRTSAQCTQFTDHEMFSARGIWRGAGTATGSSDRLFYYHTDRKHQAF